VITLALQSTLCQDWVRRYVPEWKTRFGDIRHKKLLEFFTTFTLLNPQPEHSFLDGAGGIHTYVSVLECRERYLQDAKVTDWLRRQVGKGVVCIEGDAGAIPLPDAHVDRVACHHSFEHFQGESDIAFLRQVQRLLAPGGRCCIVPLFVATRYLEVTDALTLARKFDRRSWRVIDPTASIPGGSWCGNYARIYDVTAVRERLLANIDRDLFRVTIAQVTLDGEEVPDLALTCHRHVTAINRPYRALLIERRA